MLKQMSRLSVSSLDNDEIDVNQKYQYIKEIGKGSYGEVWLVTPVRVSSCSKNSNKKYVLKRLDLRQQTSDGNSNENDNAEREARLLSTLKHPNIVAYTESFRSNDGFLNIVMAYCEGGDLYKKLKEQKSKNEKLSENQISEWFVQISMALQYMHDRSILHRDLKTQNIFLTKNDIVKVGDLGIARALESGTDLATTIIGTPYYMSPEIFSHEPYGQKSDIWALGCCVYEMTTLEHAFNAKDMNSLVLKIIIGQMPKTPKKYSQELAKLIELMLSKSPGDRPSAKEILQDPYMKQHIQKLLDKTKKKSTNSVNCSSTSINSVVENSNLNSSVDEKLSSPVRNKSSLGRLRNNDHSLPQHPPLPPSVGRSVSNFQSERISQSSEISLPSDARLRRRNRARQRDSSPSVNDDESVDSKLAAKVRNHDTISRLKHEQIQNYVKQNLRNSSDQQFESAPISINRSSSAKLSSPILLSSSPKSLKKSNSTASSLDSDHSKHSADEEVLIEPSGRESSSTRSTNLQKFASNSRKRRRENRIRQSAISSSASGLGELQFSVSRSTSQESLNVEVEKKIEGEKDINELVFALTATLKALPLSSTSSFAVNENEPKTNGESKLKPADRWSRRFQKLKAECLREISPEKLQRILNFGVDLEEPKIHEAIINEIGKDLYEKYQSSILILQVYEGHPTRDEEIS